MIKISLTKMKLKIFKFISFFHLKIKMYFLLTFDKYEYKISKISSLIIPIYNNSVFFPYLFPLTHMILMQATLMNPLMFYMIN
ncbi:hypothetical protein BM74_15905 [Bacillus thuringiensis]|uniref:Uncharacterized protein n=1 Tax=Bacillus thuringiensis TaxID=1428 RepID=A0A437SIE7_BACTU|nr:hypothetical protein BM74_15905 [Bacillus thuringiensis]